MARATCTACWLLLFFFGPPYTGWSQGPSRISNKFKTSPGLAVLDVGAWKTVQRGTEFRRVMLERTEPNHIIALKLLRFDTRWIAPRVVRSQTYNLKGAQVKVLTEKSGAIAMINANYFDGNGRPLGFLKATEELNHHISKSDLFTGIFAIKDGAPSIFHRDQFTPDQADEGLQAGPLLLTKGAALSVTRGADKQFRRSLIGIDGFNRLVIAVTDTLFGGLTWVELQEFFASPQWQVQTIDLLNLDGGGSAQLHARGTHFEEYVPGTADVPVAIGFFLK